MPEWVVNYLGAVRRMLEEADQSVDPRVKMTALRVLEQQAITIRELELNNWLDSLTAF